MVSVIIPTYQREGSVGRAIEGVIKQTYGEIEIIVVDDNGMGTEHQIATESVVSEFHNERIRYIVHPQNRGGCAARNTGILNANGDYVAFLDDDDEWSTCFVEKMLPLFDRDSIGAVYCDFFSYNGIITIAHESTDNHVDSFLESILKGECPTSTSLFIVSKEKIIAAGLFDENLPSFQDYDMWLRLSRISEFIHCKERLVLKYEGFGEQTSRNPIRRETGYNMIINKYESILSKEERVLFQEFKEYYYYDTLYRKIVYYHDHKMDYKADLFEYEKKYHTKRDRLRMWLKLHFPSKLYSYLGVLFIRFRYRNSVFLGKHTV